MLGVAIVGGMIALDNELQKKLNDPQARSKELTEEPCLRRPRTNAMFCSVLDVPGVGREVWQLVDNVVDDVNHTLRGREGDVVDGWFLFYGREEGVWCLVHTRGCECRGRTAVTWRLVYIPVLIMPWNQFLRDI
jgi:hypothetical protein